MHTYIEIYVYTYAYIYMYVYMYICISVYMYICTYVDMYPTALRATSATALGIAGCWPQNPRRWNPKSTNLDPQIVQKTTKINNKSILGALGEPLGPS